MKYNLNLSHIDNINKWQEHLCSGHGSKFTDLSADERRDLGRLNQRLRLIERRYHAEAVRISKELNRRLHDHDDWMCDYTIELKIILRLREDDPEWVKNDDNIIMVLSEILSNNRPFQDRGFGTSDLNYSESCPRCKYEFNESEVHCYLYRVLYSDYFGCFGWREMLRIGCGQVDLVVTYHAGINLSTI